MNEQGMNNMDGTTNDAPGELPVFFTGARRMAQWVMNGVEPLAETAATGALDALVTRALLGEANKAVPHHPKPEVAVPQYSIKGWNHSLRRLALLAVLALPLAASFSGCVVVKKAYEPAPTPHVQEPIAAAANPDPSMNKHSDGSIYSSQPVSLFADDKALHRGDIVLVKVNQNNTGSKLGNTQTSRQSSISANIKYLLGMEKDINKLTDYTNITKNADGTKTVGDWAPNNLIEANSANSFKGDAQTKRADTLVATVSAVVTDVLSNGNLAVYGHQTVTLNNEASVLTVQGIVRPSDLGDDNSVEASRLANSNIEFNGSGVISDKQHPGWGTRIFDWVWPF